MRRPLVFLVTLAIGGALVPAISDAQKVQTQVDVAAMQPGQEPPGFISWRTGEGGAAEWRVVDDPTASTKKAIAQTSKDTTDYRFPLAVYKPVSAANVDVTIRFKPVAGEVDEAGGIAVRLTTPDDYYVVRANALEDNVNFYRVVKGRRSQIKGAANQWHTLVSGTPWACAPKGSGSPFHSTASRSSPPRTRPSPPQERSRCGPRRTA